jgi:CRISPR-associated protein Csb2
MFCIGIRYLCGRALATHPADWERPEWPPHPDRLFMALVAAHFQGDGNGDESGRAALEWLENQAAPSMHVSGGQVRQTTTSYVPVNDMQAPRINRGQGPSAGQIKSGLALLPESRPKQPRQFPAVIPDDPSVFFIWPSDPPPHIAAALARLCLNVTNVGHSSSLVQTWVEADVPEPDLVPVGERAAQFRLRVSGVGRLRSLEARYNAGLRPVSALWAGYERPKTKSFESPALQTCFDRNLIVLRRTEGHALGLESTLHVTQVLRDTMMALCVQQPPPEWVTGHKSDGRRSEEDHLAFMPLPHVGSEHADGHLLGLAIAVPRDIPPEEQARCWQGVLFDELGMPKRMELRMGKLGLWQVVVDDRENREVALRPETWNSASQTWATVTPISLDRHPKGRNRWKDIEDSIRRACVRIGLQEPLDVALTPTSMFTGTPAARGYPLLVRGPSLGPIQHTHASITFPVAVTGPVLLGAGRYRGYGVCRPLALPGGQE